MNRDDNDDNEEENKDDDYNEEENEPFHDAEVVMDGEEALVGGQNVLMSCNELNHDGSRCLWVEKKVGGLKIHKGRMDPAF